MDPLAECFIDPKDIYHGFKSLEPVFFFVFVSFGQICVSTRYTILYEVDYLVSSYCYFGI